MNINEQQTQNFWQAEACYILMKLYSDLFHLEGTCL